MPITTHILSQPPFGDVDDRIRAIAKGLGLRTVLWKYDTNDAEVGDPNNSAVTKASVAANYQSFIDKAQAGAFDSVRPVFLPVRAL